MSDLVGNPEDRFSHDVVHIEWCTSVQTYQPVSTLQYFSKKNWTSSMFVTITLNPDKTDFTTHKCYMYHKMQAKMQTVKTVIRLLLWVFTVCLDLYELCREKNCLRGFRPGLTQTGYTVTEDGWSLAISDLESRGVVLAM